MAKIVLPPRTTRARGGALGYKTQVSLSEGMALNVRELSNLRGVSDAEVIRWALANFLPDALGKARKAARNGEVGEVTE